MEKLIVVKLLFELLIPITGGYTKSLIWLIFSTDAYNPAIAPHSTVVATAEGLHDWWWYATVINRVSWFYYGSPCECMEDHWIFCSDSFL